MNIYLHTLRLFFVALILLFAGMRPAAAVSCEIYMGGTQMFFGSLNLLDGGNKSTSASLTYGCSGAAEPLTMLICLSLGSGPGGGYETRSLRNSSNNQVLRFNLYTDASLSTVWGSIDSGGAPSGVPVLLPLPANKYASGTVQIYGSISPNGQTGRSEGTYDTKYMGGWPVKMSYAVYQQGMPISCSNAFSTHTTTTFYIQATVSKDCRIDGTSILDFGTAFNTLNENLDGTSAVTVTCNGTAYRVGLNNGQHADGNVRRMAGPAGYIRYELYRDASRVDRWGNNFWYDGVARTGTGLPQSLTVYGRVPKQQLPGSGEYSDTITVTIDY